MNLRLLALALPALLPPSPIGAQIPETLPLVLTLPGSTRALALGGAYPIGQTGSDAIFYNPANGDRLRGASLAVQWAGSESTLYTLSAATDWFGGALAFGMMALDYHAGEAAGLAIPAAAPANLLAGGTTAISERSALVAYARRIRGVRLAATGRLIEQRLPDERNRTAAADLAAAYDFGPAVAGLAVQNLGPGMEVHGEDTALPLGVRFDASTDSYPLGPLDVSLAARVTWVRAGDVVPGAGIELGYWPVAGRTFFARGGIARALDGEDPFTAGAGFSGDKLSVDYAWAGFEAGPVHRVSVRWR
ncbi:MAG TPA: hypothetical protein VK939_08500 [Longimicrobiales bacterium]|nr:hypothetical protein [Longimicrobiales bacterium]